MTWFQSFVARIERRYPKVRLEIDADLAGGLAAKLTRRQIDIALLPGPVDLAGVVRVSLGSCTLRWLGHPRFAPQDQPLTAAAFAELPTIGMPQDASVYHSMVSWFEEAGITPSFIHRCNSFSVMALLVRRGIGVSLLPPELFTEDLAAGTLKVLIEHPRTKHMDYSAADLRATDNALVPQLAALAREESWFLGTHAAGPTHAGWSFRCGIESRATLELAGILNDSKSALLHPVLNQRRTHGRIESQKRSSGHQPPCHLPARC